MENLTHQNEQNTEVQEINYFLELAKINVNKYIEQKGGFNYLPWAYAVQQLRSFDPYATWEVKRFKNENGVEMPYLQTPAGCFVETSVTCKGVTLSQLHPVLDHRNKTSQNPDAFEINRAIQRCLVKNIALHGLGLYLYAGEDLPKSPIENSQIQAINKALNELATLRNVTPNQILEKVGVQDLRQLEHAQADMLLDKLKMWVEKAKEESKE